MTLFPDGNYVAGCGCRLMPDGRYMGAVAILEPDTTTSTGLSEVRWPYSTSAWGGPTKRSAFSGSIPGEGGGQEALH